MTSNLAAKITVDPTFGCWLWTGQTDRNGYGIVWRGRTPVKAYLVVYQAEEGDVPTGKVLDHECRVRACVAPHHLEPVSKAVNEMRKLWRVRARRTHCRKGHEMKTNRVVVSHTGGIVCRQCNQEAKGPTT